MRQSNRPIRIEGMAHSAGAVLLGNVDLILRHLSLNVPIPLILGLARGMDVHDESLHLAVVAHSDCRVALANSWKPIDFVTRNLVTPASDAFDGYGVATESRNEAVVFFRLVRLARDDSDNQQGSVSHGRKAYRGIVTQQASLH
jgi:hypothetical protein